ncbi:MAG: BamA/TamA family outer membrane protein [Bacteroidota bacterium]|nr:BamA/TamA family outer membrane protein [Bacteroidota bacterium]
MSRSLAACLVLLLPVAPVPGQTDFLEADGQTVVRSVSFDFRDTRRELRLFSAHELNELIVTRGPRWRERISIAIGLRSLDAFILDPIELQSDVVRMRSAYHEAGYLNAYVDYAGSTLNAATNRIDIVFSIRQGAPLIIQDVGFFAEAGYLAYAFEGDMRDRWITFRDATSFKTGDRLTSFELVRIEDQVLGWLKDQGYAFARLQTQLEVDSLYNVADISFLVDSGPISMVDSISIEGERRIDDQVIRRTLPFGEGDVFAQSQLLAAQRALFALNLFSAAQVNVPDQPRDSTVHVLITVQQARLRHISAETGYHQRTGLTGQGTLSKRNFLGGGRLLSVSAEVESGLLAFTETGAQVSRRLRTSVTLGMPQIGFSWLNASIEPYLLYERDPLLDESDRYLGYNRRSYGVSNSWYAGDPRRQAISLSYLLSREAQFTAARPDPDSPVRDVYDKSVLTLSGTISTTDDYLRPTRGWIIRPAVEQAGIAERFLGIAGLGLEYTKAQLDLAGYVPLGRRRKLTVRVGAGKIWPAGVQSVTYYSADGPVTIDAQFAAPYENRYDAVRFYTGGASDVRGWSTGFAGAKSNRTEQSGEELTHRFYEPAGGLTRLFVGTELQVPLTGDWHAAVFADAGQVSSYAAPTCAAELFADPALVVPVRLPYEIQCGLADDGRLRWDRFRIGAGIGIRYDTPVGLIRVDLAVKANPDPLDLQSPRNAFRSARGLEEAYYSDWRRIRVHFSIGQPF